ncbi:hypothetical protein ACFOPQ_13935 [Deinococcus antarcticus]|uniref:Uncharacterized protein n=1 Tax=Deinococcus antarcticus TaxID=1298767 RepID=A0ABV8ACD9_9DEIO
MTLSQRGFPFSHSTSRVARNPYPAGTRTSPCRYSLGAKNASM